MHQNEKAALFASQHVPGKPLVLYNIWDAGGAVALEKAGAKAIATGSMSVAAAQGYPDGEQIPLDFLLRIAQRIVAATALPVSVDFEGAYASDPDQVAGNVARLIETGAVGINFEDQIVGTKDLYPMGEQAERIKAARAAANASSVPLFINARTDLFLKAGPEGDHGALISEALERARAYADAGADGFFVPMLSDPGLIAEVCAQSPLPVNVMSRIGATSTSSLATFGVARQSFGPAPYFKAMKDLATDFEAATA